LRELGSLAVIAAVISGSFAVGTALLTVDRERRGRELLVRAALWVVVGFGAGLTLVVTLLPYGAAAPDRFVSFDVVSDLVAIAHSFPSWGETAQLVINLLLLSWLAIAIPLLVPRWGIWETASLVLGTAVLIEVLQLVIPTGRVASLSDVLINSLGAALVAALVVRVVRPRLDAWVQRSADVPVEG